MSFSCSRLVLSFFVTLLFCELPSARLTGTLTPSEDKEVITASLVNSGSDTISISQSNNIFDFRGLSMPFTVTDDAGNKVPIAWTHSIVIDEDYFDLVPGAEFKRDFNLTDYIDLEPETGSVAKNISISLPSRIQGFESFSASDRESSTSESRFVNQQSKARGFSPRSSIILESEPLRLTWTSYARGSHVEKRQWTSRGISVIPGSCTGNSLSAIQNSILDASYLAGAGINAATSFTVNPFQYFFSGDIKTSTTVAGVYQRVIQSQQGNGNLIGATCFDQYNNCKTGATNIPGYSAQASGRAPIVVMCPAGLAFPRNPVPCTANPGTISLGWLMLHEMTHIYSISGPSLDIQDTTGESARDVQDSLDDGIDTTLDANAYGFCGSWSWDLGLGGPPWNQQKTCLGNFPKGNFDTIPTFGPDATMPAGNADPGFPGGVSPGGK